MNKFTLTDDWTSAAVKQWLRNQKFHLVIYKELLRLDLVIKKTLINCLLNFLDKILKQPTFIPTETGKC